MKSEILITGGAGFIGSHITEVLLRSGFSVIVYDNLSTGDIKNVPNHQDCQLIVGDICNQQELREVFEHHPDIGAVIHMAAQSKVGQSMANPYSDAEVNIMGTIKVLQTCSDFGVKKFLYASSAAVYGEVQHLPVTEDTPCLPLSPYGVSKLSAEYYVLNFSMMYNMNAGVFRFANVFGPRQKAGTESGVITIFINSLLNGEQPVIFGDGKQTRDFVYVLDVAEAMKLFLLGDSESTSQAVYQVSTNSETTIEDLLDQLKEITGKQVDTIYHKPREGDIRYSRLSNQKLKDDLSWNHNTSLLDGLRATVAYEKEQKKD